MLAGGRGSRLWPLSTPGRPKAFAPVLSDEALVATQVRRAVSWCGSDRVYVAITRGQERALDDALPGWDARRILVGEPSWDTGAAILAAATRIAVEHPSAVLLLLSPDQYVSDEALLLASLRESVTCARGGPHWVSVGVRPTEPSTALGYMRLGPPLVGTAAHVGLGYVEKPDAERARALCADGNHLWNVGIFAVALPTLRTAFATYAPGATTSLSIDHAVLEKLTPDGPVRHAFVEGTFGWSDVGTWAGLERALPCDRAGNRVRGSVEHAACRDTLLVATREATLSVHGLVERRVVVAHDGLLVADARHDHAPALTSPIDGSAPSAVVETGGLLVSRRGGEVRVQAVVRAGAATLVVDRPAGTTARRAAAAVSRSLAGVLERRGRAVLVPSVGATMTPIYEALVRDHRAALDWRRVTIVQMDELLGVPEAQTFRAALVHDLARRLEVGFTLTLDDLESVRRAERYLARHGIDVALHGIGVNGHVALHEPGGSGEPGLVTLAPSTREVLEARLGVTCRSGLTLGLDTLRAARETYLVAVGATKRAAMHGMLFREESPASALCAAMPVVFTDESASPIDG